MCGVVAIASRGRPTATRELDGALAAMAHRGPDGHGVFVSPDGACVLGHTRLAVVDPTGSAQPIANEDGSIVAVVNGELYGFEAERARLQERGHRFRTAGDSELVVHLYEELQLDFVNRLRGEFAIVLWDAKARRLVACRDRFGVKPLLMARQAERVCFASNAKALFALGVPAAWDAESLFDAAGMQYPLPGRTLYAGVQTVEPGHVVTVDASGHVAAQRYWDLDYPRLVDRSAADADLAVAEVRSALEDAVQVRLRADVPVVAQLSGGLDSTAVAAMAAGRGELTCFTLGFDDPRYDEAALARASAEHLGVRHIEVMASRDALVEHLEEAVGLGEGLGINGHLPAKLLLSRAVRRAGFKVILTGEGADEVFAGYAHLRADLGADVRSTNSVSSGIMLPDGAGLSTAAVRDALGFVPSFLAAKATLGARARSLLRDDVQAQLADRDTYALLMEQVDRTQLAGRHHVEQSLYLWCKTALPSYLLRTLGDGMEMASSIEGRLPFLDHRLFDVARRLPVELKIKDGIEKWVLRQAVAPIVPRAIVEREKHPLLAPPLADSPSFRALLRELLPDMPFFESARVQQALTGYEAMDARERGPWDPVLVLVATVGLLTRRLRLAA